MGKLFGKRYKDITVGAFFAVIAIAYLIGASMIPDPGLVSVGAKFMPTIYGVGLLSASVVLILTGISKLKYYPKEETAESVHSGGMVNVLKVAVLIVVFVGIMEIVGFVPASIVFLFLLCCLLTPAYKKRNYLGFGIFAVVLPLVADFLFRNYMNLYLPTGMIFGN